MSSIKFPWTLVKNLKLSKRNFAQNQRGCENEKGWGFIVRKLAFEWSGYNKYGLYTHDVIDYNNPVVCKALCRLPMDMLDARNFRLIRAMQLSFLKIHLPEEKWVTYEQDLKYRYLDPYMEEIKAEQTEINEFDCYNYSDNDSPAGKVK